MIRRRQMRSRVKLCELLAATEYGISNPVTEDGDLPIVGMANIIDGRVRVDALRRVSSQGVDVPRYRLSKNDVLFNRTNSLKLVGKTGIVANAPTEDVVFASYLVRLVPNPDHATAEYLNLVLNAPSTQRQIRRLATPGVSQVNVNPTALGRSVLVAAPPLDEQRLIGTTVAQWSNAIELLDTLITCKRAFVESFLQRVLAMRSTPAGQAQWLHRRFSDFFTHYIEENGDHDRPVFSCSKVHGIVRQSDKFARRLAPADTRHYKVVRSGDLVIDRMLLWDGSLAFVEIGEGVVSPDYATFRFNAGSGDREFFKALLKSKRMRHRYQRLARGSNTRRRRVLPKDFLSVSAVLPDVAAQRSIGDYLRTSGDELRLLQRLRRALEHQRDVVVEKLLTGEIQLSDE